MGHLGKILMALFIISPLCNILHSQDLSDELVGTYDANVIYTQQAVGGITAHTEGWGFFFRRARIPSIFRKEFWEAEAVTMHDEHEYKLVNQENPDASPYYFGKLNGMETIRLGLGVMKMLWRKNDLSYVQVDYVYAVGASLAILKPVYLDVLVSNPVTGQVSPVSQEYNPNTDNPTNIYGRSSVFDGFGQLSFYPGAYGRIALNFDFSNKHRTIKAIEVGVVVDVYDKVIPMMAFVQNNQIFTNLYLNFNIGKRWGQI